MTLREPLAPFPVVRCNSFDAIRDALGRIYAKPLLQPKAGVRAPEVVYNAVELRQLGFSYLRYGADIQLEFPPTERFAQKIPIAGHAAVTLRGRPEMLAVGNTLVTSPGESHPIDLGADFEQLVLRLNAAPVTRKLTALIGAPIHRPLRVEPLQDFASPQAHTFRSLIQFVIEQLSRGSIFPPALIEELEQTVIVSFLLAHRHNYSEPLAQKPPSVAPWQVRRTEAYIEANWNKPILIEDIAAVVGASARSIFRAFRQTRGYSPMAFAKEVRLRNAYKLLQEADATTRVADIATACGYSDLGSFSKDYRHAFGEAPSCALKRSKARCSVELPPNSLGKIRLAT